MNPLQDTSKITIRDHIAIQAMNALVMRPCNSITNQEIVASLAYGFADAMIACSNKAKEDKK